MPLEFVNRFGPIQCPGCKESFVRRRERRCPHCLKVEFIKGHEWFVRGPNQYYLDLPTGRIIPLDDEHVKQCKEAIP